MSASTAAATSASVAAFSSGTRREVKSFPFIARTLYQEPPPYLCSNFGPSGHVAKKKIIFFHVRSERGLSLLNTGGQIVLARRDLPL